MNKFRANGTENIAAKKGRSGCHREMNTITDIKKMKFFVGLFWPEFKNLTLDELE